MWHVYLLYSVELDRYYIGKTNNIKRRLFEHNNKTEKFSRRANDWTIVGLIPCSDSKEAYHLEKKLKRSKNRKYTVWYFENNDRGKKHLADQ